MQRPVPVPEELINFIRTGRKFIVAGHKEPDGDCVGSQLALAAVLERLGKEAIRCSAGPFKRTEIKPFEGFFKKAPTAEERDGAAVLLVDCGSTDRTGDLEPLLADLPLAIIDHHATGDHGKGKGIVFLDAEAPSVTFMVLAVIEALGLPLTAEEATSLFFGLCTDTGFFRHVDNGGAETFAYASRLVQAGANPKNAFDTIHGGKSLGSRILMGLVLSRTESYYDGKLLLSTEQYEETQRFGREGRDSDTLYQVLQAVAGVEAIAIIRQETPETCAIGLRSRDAVDVAKVAVGLGGGGHKNAAGLTRAGAIGELKPRIIEAFRDQLGTGLEPKLAGY
ncbi:MAG: bifunctional oligoribonuclease/PAP phosphatase NrnA [Treponema sp.]|jgi:phosphoesterase RecJ-like protein|nr:bifunctional oligoribonuclease/PAP phosphatase NrnA [Treponema sp.]